ncbi:MAG: hypothetical protein DRO39_01165 [Thermoprotei archaeon]|nr:MAG: hypothetical protein DRO39_01165 [Thermoprotei archaeon]
MVMGLRRYGKTSLILTRLESAGAPSLYEDYRLWEYVGLFLHYPIHCSLLGLGPHPRTTGAIRAPLKPWEPLICVRPLSARLHAAVTSLVVVTSLTR